MAGFGGDGFTRQRAHMGVTLKEAEQATRINRHHLAALEEENFAALPPLIYQRGYSPQLCGLPATGSGQADRDVRRGPRHWRKPSQGRRRRGSANRHAQPLGS